MVTVNCGQVVGTPDPDANLTSIFYGIPYGANAGGANRWQPPLKASCWPAGTPFNASQPGDICYQMDMSPTPGKPSEDCLHLDVRTRYTDANPPSELRPVVVFLHGGSLVVGSSRWYTGLSSFPQRGDVVLVSVNYRLGPLGFLAHDLLSERDSRGRNVSGNYGLLDQIMALQWVQDNIHAFGGDRTRVTLLGQSSGGTSIFGLYCSPLAKGLFSGAISLSGSPNVTMSLAQASQQNAPVIYNSTRCGKAADVMACLLSLTPTEAQLLFPDYFNVEPLLPTSPQGQKYPGLIIIDGVTLTGSLEESLESATVGAAPLIIQSTVAEMDTFEPKPEIYALSADNYTAYLTTWLTQHSFSSDVAPVIANTVRDLYQTEQLQSTELAYQAFLADYSFYCANLQLGFSAVKGGVPVYVSLVTSSPANPLHVFPGLPPARYASHMFDYMVATYAWDIFPAFGTFAPPYHPGTTDFQLGDSLFAQWLAIIEGDAAALEKTGLKAFNSDPRFPDVYSVALQTSYGAIMSQNYNQQRCATLNAEPLNLGKPFWLCN